ALAVDARALGAPAGRSARRARDDCARALARSRGAGVRCGDLCACGLRRPRDWPVSGADGPGRTARLLSPGGLPAAGILYQSILEAYLWGAARPAAGRAGMLERAASAGHLRAARAPASITLHLRR